MADGIRIISQSRGEISILCPPDGSNTVFLYIGVAALLIAGLVFYKQRSWSIALFALVPGVVSLILGAYSLTSVTTINASAQAGVLTVRNMVAGIPVGNRAYRLTEVRGVRVGFMRGGMYLYADLADGNAPQLLPTSYRHGYQQAADALNTFLNSFGAGIPENAPSQ
ncbi:MAG TPA: hypothetical protein VK638_36375 [Edaphobacter sp.]|nr:hypothetical protein [Edaphobacter sp.]